MIENSIKLVYYTYMIIACQGMRITRMYIQNHGWYVSPIFANWMGFVAVEIKLVNDWITGTVAVAPLFWSCWKEDQISLERQRLQALTFSLSVLQAITSVRLTTLSTLAATPWRKAASPTVQGRLCIIIQEITSSLPNRHSCCSRAYCNGVSFFRISITKTHYTSGSVKDRAIAKIPEVRIPSVNIGPRKVCMFRVRRKGTTSLVAHTGRLLDIPGRSSVMAIWPVDLHIWKRLGWRLERQRAYVIKEHAASWEANCLRIRHNSLGPLMERIIYW